MNAALLYLIESTVCLLVLYAIYWFFLRRDTFFQVNRFYLMAMILFSVLVPLLPIHLTTTGPTASIMILLDPVLITPAKVHQTIVEHLQWIEIAAIVYLTGALIFLLRFGLQLFQLFRIPRHFGIKVRNGQKVVFVDRGYSPFSFFNLVFINERMIPSASLSTILEHEKIHIRQLHTVDIILAELATIIQWFNPVIWLAGREMKTIHEYLADEGVLQTGISRTQYQQMILDETMGIQVNNLANNFNVSLLKKRITMMTKSKSGTWAKSKMLIALPALVALLFLLSASSITGTSDNGNNEIIQIKPAFITPPEAMPVTATMTPQEKAKEKPEVKSIPVQPDKNGIYTRVEKQPQYTGGDDAMIKFLVENINYPEEAKKKGIQGTVFVTFIVQANGAVTNVKILRGIGSGCDEESVRVVKIMPNWIPGMEKGKNVAVQFNLPIKFKLDADKKKEQVK
jgi:TonB family protein